MPESSHSSAGRKVWLLIAVLLTPAIVAPLLVGTYAREEPSIAGFPFFFWYQFLWIAIAAGLTGICYWLITSHERRERERREGGA